MKSVSVYLDKEGRILSVHPGDLSGNSGWVAVPEKDLTQGTGASIAELMEHAMDDGAARYIWRDGRAHRRTDAEIEADKPPKPAPVHTMEERISTLEAESTTTMSAVAEVYEMFLRGGGV